VSPAGSRGRALGQGVRGRSPPEAERFLVLSYVWNGAKLLCLWAVLWSLTVAAVPPCVRGSWVLIFHPWFGGPWHRAPPFGSAPVVPVETGKNTLQWQCCYLTDWWRHNCVTLQCSLWESKRFSTQRLSKEYPNKNRKAKRRTTFFESCAQMKVAHNQFDWTHCCRRAGSRRPWSSQTAYTIAAIEDEVANLYLFCIVFIPASADT